MGISAEVLDRFIEIRREFLEYYGTTGLISVSTMGVHLTESDFIDTFTEYAQEPMYMDSTQQYLTAKYNGVTFFCVSYVPAKSESPTQE